MEVRVVEPPVKIKLVRVRKQYQMREKELVRGQKLGLDRADKEVLNTLVEKYRLIETQQDGLTAADAARASGTRTFDLTSRREKRTFSRLSLVAEVSRYLNRSPLEIEDLLDATSEGTDELVTITNDSTMVAKAAYAIHRGLIEPKRIVLLAFNKQAAEELKERTTQAFQRCLVYDRPIQATLGVNESQFGIESGSLFTDREIIGRIIP